MQPEFGAAAFQRETDASDGAMGQLERYRELLETWNERLNLVGPSALETFWLRHAFDSAQLAAVAPHALTWADLGAGAGFPGLVLAILMRGTAGVRVHLVESQAKRCRFLDTVATELALPVEVHNARAEALRLTVDVVAARACAPLDRLLGFAHGYIRAGAVGLFLKGQAAESELTAARASWRIDATLLPSRSDPEGRIVRVTRLSRA